MIDQLALGALGGSAILLSQSQMSQQRRLAPVLGLLAQPFWFYTTYVHEQWAIFGLCFFYTFAWWRGFRLFWLTPE